MDILDFAEEQRSMAVSAAVNSISERLNDPTAAAITHCVDCECEIPESRKKHLPSAIRCIDCQKIYEGENIHG